MTLYVILAIFWISDSVIYGIGGNWDAALAAFSAGVFAATIALNIRDRERAQ